MFKLNVGGWGDALCKQKTIGLHFHSIWIEPQICFRLSSSIHGWPSNECKDLYASGFAKISDFVETLKKGI